LEYSIVHGPIEEKLIKDYAGMNLPLPSKIANAPQLRLGLELFFSVFRDLDSTRQIGNFEGSIPWTAIKQYCDEYDIVGEQRDDVFYFVRNIDEAYLKIKARADGKP